MPLARSALRLTADELEIFLTHARTARVATVSSSGQPHVSPLWFVWRNGDMYINSLKRSKRGVHLESGSPVAVCVDDGDDYAHLRGAVLYGTFEDATDDPRLDEVREALIAKYWDGVQIPESRAHRWLRLRPSKVVSWDFKKIPAGADPRLRAVAEARDGS